MDQSKEFNDPVHGHIEIPPLCIKIIDTPEFQRLRRIKQLGGVDYVYYGATHSRFEHSIGVCFLAGELLRHLQNKQKELNIKEQDILCVQIAGLCHDLGHGPLSNLWENSIVPAFKLTTQGKWEHEKWSVIMFDYLIQNNCLKDDFKKHLKLENDEQLKEELTFIRELISRSESTPKGRKEDKAFLYEIIANEENGIDVDKWDYFARDCYYLGHKSNFNHRRMIKSARVLKITEQQQRPRICYRDKDVLNVYEMFHTRYILHQVAYQHKTVKSVECMLKDALVYAKTLLRYHEGQDPVSPFNRKRTSHRKEMKLFDIANVMMKYSKKTDDKWLNRIFEKNEQWTEDEKEIVNAVEAFVKVDDSVFTRIMQLGDTCNDGNLNEAKILLKRLEERKIYRYLQSDPIDPTKDLSTDDQSKTFLQKFNEKHEEHEESSLTEDDLSLEVVSFDYGKNNEDPVKKVHFYRKDKPNEAIPIPKEKVSSMLPEKFSETRMILLIKKCSDDGIFSEIDRANASKRVWKR